MERYPANGAPEGLSRRMQDLYRHYVGEAGSELRDGLSVFTVGTKWDTLLDETGLLSCPGLYPALPTLADTAKSAAETVTVPKRFYAESIAERRASLLQTVLLERMPVSLAPGDLLAGEYRSILLSRCLSRAEAGSEQKLVRGKKGLREAAFSFHAAGYGCCGAAGGGFAPDYAGLLKKGFSGVAAECSARYDALSNRERKREQGAALRAMLTASKTPTLLAAQYATLCQTLLASEQDGTRRSELQKLQACLLRVPEQPAQDFYEAVQALWLAHMLTGMGENRPGGGVSMGRVDQYLLPYWETSQKGGMTRAFCKELVKCLLLHCCGMADAMARAYGETRPQVFTLSGSGPDGRDETNELTQIFLEAADELGPLPGILLQIRLHDGTPDALLDRIANMLNKHPSLPLLLSFDDACEKPFSDGDRSAYFCIGGTVNAEAPGSREGFGCRLNLAKAVELALGDGAGLVAYEDPVSGKPCPPDKDARKAGDPVDFSDFEAFYAAFLTQLDAVIEKAVSLRERCAALTVLFAPAPYSDCLPADAKVGFITVEGAGFVTAVNALLAVKYLVFDTPFCTMEALLEALHANWEGFEVLQAAALFRAPKLGRGIDEADALAARVANDFSRLVGKRVSAVTGAPFLPCLSAPEAYFNAEAEPLASPLAATPDGRKKGEPLPPLLADGETAVAMLAAMGRIADGPASVGLPLSLPPTALLDEERQKKCKYFLRGAMKAGGPGLLLSLPPETDAER